jgi:predicted membrane GTPase involved in stress response
MEREHVDLEKSIKLSTEISFSFSSNEFVELSPLEIKIKKKILTKTQTVNVDLRDRTKGSLF